jgi:hypothetical protein
MAFRYGANVRANGIRLHYLRYGGSGTPLIVLPGITSPAATWDFVARRLAATNDVYVLDIRGRGLSQGGSELDYSLDAYAADVVAFASALRFDRFMLLGHWMTEVSSQVCNHSARKRRCSSDHFGDQLRNASRSAPSRASRIMIPWDNFEGTLDAIGSFLQA